MVKKRTSYLSPRSLLTKKEFSDYQMQKKIIERDKLQRRIEQGKESFKKYSKEKRYEESKTGQVSKKVGGFLRGIQSLQRKGVTRSLYGGNTISKVSKRTNKGSYSGRGRPRGTYDKRYAKYGGVYGYRKAMSLQRWKERQQILERSAVNPRQQEVLRRIQQRDAYARQSPERRVIPSTGGELPLKGIMDEINNACNLVK